MSYKALIISSVIVFFFGFNNHAFAQNCTEEDHKTAEFWKYYDPEDAYNFGAIVKNIVSTKNKDGFLGLFDYELSNGPRRQHIKQNSFESIFPKTFIDSIIESKIYCSPIGWRGFLLEGPGGSIWYNLNDKGKWVIFSINGANEEPPILENARWVYEDQIIHPSCFTKPYISNDNFEEFALKFNIKDQPDFFENPYKYYGNKISNYDAFTPSWCSDNFCPGSISIGVHLNNCPKIDPVNKEEVSVWKFHSTQNSHRGIYQSTVDADGLENEQYYSVIGNIPKKYCEEITPDLDGCLEAKLIEVGDYSGGTFGWHFSYGVFGLFEQLNNKKVILPLIYFNTKNDALNYYYEHN